VGTGAEVSDTWQIAANNLGGYDLSVNGPNGFLRSYKGSVLANAANLDIRTSYDKQGNGITLFSVNLGADVISVRFTDSYTGGVHTRKLKPGEGVQEHWQSHQSYGWYDLIIEAESDSAFRYQLAGHVETGQESRTDPAIASAS
jgi:phospholipase C